MILAISDSLQPALIAAVVSLAVALFARANQTAAWQRDDKRRVLAEYREALSELERGEKAGQRAGLAILAEQMQTREAEGCTQDFDLPSVERIVLLARSRDEIKENSTKLLDAARAEQLMAEEKYEIALDIEKKYRRYHLAAFHLMVVADRRTRAAAFNLMDAVFAEDNSRYARADALYLLEVRREIGYLLHPKQWAELFRLRRR